MTIQKRPYIVEETPGTKYYCMCGQTKNDPYCDGSHKVTNFKPMKVEIPENRRCAYCGCRQSQELPFCDGTHTTL